SSKKPTELEVKAVNSSALAVTWRRPKRDTQSSPDGYRITWRKADAPASAEAEVTYASGDAEGLVISSLEPYQKYVVNVSGISTRSSQSADTFSARGQGETHPEPCSQPKDLLVERVSGNESSSKIIVEWSPPDGKVDPPIDGYLVVICPLVVDKSLRGKSSCRTAKTSPNETKSVFVEEPGFSDYVVEVRAFVEHDCDTIE
ncbi:hypothetical protein ISCGN_020839, partial [Ixodes scapularis]